MLYKSIVKVAITTMLLLRYLAEGPVFSEEPRQYVTVWPAQSLCLA